VIFILLKRPIDGAWAIARVGSLPTGKLILTTIQTDKLIITILSQIHGFLPNAALVRSLCSLDCR
jgi:hypothetical protein